MDHWCGSSGARRMLILYESLEHVGKETIIPFQSDVFSLKLHDEVSFDFLPVYAHSYSWRLEALLFAGTRNGSVRLFDLRMSAKQQQMRDMLAGRYTKLQSIVHSLDVIHEWHLLVAGTNQQVRWAIRLLVCFDVMRIRSSIRLI